MSPYGICMPFCASKTKQYGGNPALFRPYVILPNVNTWSTHPPPCFLSLLGSRVYHLPSPLLWELFLSFSRLHNFYRVQRVIHFFCGSVLISLLRQVHDHPFPPSTRRVLISPHPGVAGSSAGPSPPPYSLIFVDYPIGPCYYGAAVCSHKSPNSLSFNSFSSSTFPNPAFDASSSPRAHVPTYFLNTWSTIFIFRRYSEKHSGGES